MNKNAFFTLAVAALAACLSAPARAQTGVLQRCDKAMADVEQMGRTIAECDALLKAATAALAKVDDSKDGPAEKVVTTTSSLSVDLTRAAMTQPLLGRLIAHYAYSAFASGDLSQCAPLIHLSDTQVLQCRRLVADLGFVKARYGTNAELVAACRRTDEDDARGAGASPCCSLLAENRSGPAACAKLAPKCFDPAACRAWFASAAGDASACRSLPMPPAEDCTGDECPRLRAEAVANCEGDAAFAKAFKAGSAAACAGSQRCRTLMGEGKAVAAEIAAKDLKNPVGAWFLKGGWKTPSVVSRSRGPVRPAPASEAAMKKIEFRGFVCAEPMTSKENRAALGSALSAAHACLADLETALSNPGRDVLNGIDEREEKIARQSLRLNKYFEGKPAKAPAPAAK